MVKALTKAVIPSSVKFGIGVVDSIPLEYVFENMAFKSLYRLSWGGGGKKGDEWKKISAEFDERLARMTKEARMTGWLEPKGVYGVFPAQAVGESLQVFDPEDHEKLLTTFDFPRQIREPHRSLIDYFAQKETGEKDVVALQFVTVGKGATAHIDELNRKELFSEAYFAHGLAVQSAEGTAAYLHQHVRQMMGIGPKQGKRYSWGYPALPDLKEHKKLFEVLPIEESLGARLTVSNQFMPEQSTGAIIIHHPGAIYFNVGETRLSMLVNEMNENKKEA